MMSKDVACQIKYFDLNSKTMKMSIGKIELQQLKTFNENEINSVSIRNFDDQTIEGNCILSITEL